MKLEGNLATLEVENKKIKEQVDKLMRVAGNMKWELKFRSSERK